MNNDFLERLKVDIDKAVEIVENVYKKQSRIFEDSDKEKLRKYLEKLDNERER